MALEIEALVAPLSDDAPAGEDLEYDLEFGELTRTAEGTPEKVTGDSVIEAVPPDWGAVKEQSLALFERTRDLRVAIHLTNALLHTSGFSGMRDGLQLVHALSTNLWESVHPQLDEDDGDPTFRCNAVAELANRSVALEGVLDAPFVEARRAGHFSLRDLKIIEGELKQKPHDTRPPPEKALVDAALQEVEADDLQATLDVVSECIDAAKAIQQTYVEQVGAMDAPDLAPLVDYLEEVQKFVAGEMAQLGIGEAPDAAEGAAEGGGGAATAGGGQAITGDIRSREDVRRVLEKICVYYEQHEPSSPVPILLKRAASLVNKSFLDILNDLTPSGVAEANIFAGEAASGEAWASPESWSGDSSSTSTDEQDTSSSDDSW